MFDIMQISRTVHNIVSCLRKTVLDFNYCPMLIIYTLLCLHFRVHVCSITCVWNIFMIPQSYVGEVRATCKKQ